MAMVRACDEAGVRLFVVKQNRRNATLQLLKRAVEKERFGRIYMVNVNVFWTRPQAYYDSAAWRGTWEFDGGAFMNQASHYVDLLDWLDRPGRERAGLHGHAGAQHRGRGHGRRQRALAHRRARLDERHDADLPEEPRRIDHDPRREGHRAHRRRRRQRDPALGVRRAGPEDDALVEQASYETTSVYGFGHPLYYDNVINVLRGEAEPETDGREGLKSLEIADRRLPLGARRQARRAAAGVLRWRRRSTRRPSSTTARSSATSTRVWHWVHVCGGARIGARLLARPERLRRQRRRHRRQRQDPEQRLGLRRRHARGRRVLRPEHGLHQRLQPALGGRRARTSTATHS